MLIPPYNQVGTPILSKTEKKEWKQGKLHLFRYKSMEMEFGIVIRVRIWIVVTISMESSDDFGSKKLIKIRFESDLEQI